MIACERVGCQAHDAELEEFCPQRNAALAVLVREVSSRDGENQEGNGEKQRHNKYKPKIAALFRERGVEDQKTDEPFEGVVAEGALELHRDERPESGEAARLNCGLRLGLARWWRHGCASLSARRTAGKRSNSATVAARLECRTGDRNKE